MGEMRFSINAGQAQNEIRNVTDKIKELNSAMNEAAQQKDWGSFNSMAAAMNNLEAYKKGVLYEAKGLQSNLPMQASVNNVFSNATGIINSTGNGLMAAGNGNLSGVLNSGVQGAGGVGSLLKLLGASSGLVGGILGGLGLAAGVGVAIDKTSNVWEDQMDDAVLNNTYYNDQRFGLSSKQNSTILRNRYNEAAELKKGTQYTTSEVMQLQNDIAKYGYTGENVGIDTQAILYAQHNTGASRESLAKLAGLQNLYGYDGAMAVQNAYQGLKDSGMTDARFEEFLDGITRAMESGISKGFVGSVEDIVNNVSLFSKLSGGNEIWVGSSGAERVAKIGEGFASAVNLNSTNDLMMYGAAKGVASTITGNSLADFAKKSGVDVSMLENNSSLLARMIMEQGTNGDYFIPMLQNYTKNVKSQFGDMPEYEMQTYMDAFGLNVTGAAQLQSLLNTWADSGYSTDIKGKVQDIVSSPENKSTETNYREDINKIKDVVTQIGQNSLDIKEKAMNRLSGDVEAIKNFLLKDENPVDLEPGKEIIDTLTDDKEKAELYKTQLETDASYYPLQVFGSDNQAGIGKILDDNGADPLTVGRAYFTGEGLSDYAGNKFIDKSRFAQNLQSRTNKEESFDDIFVSLATQAAQKGGLADKNGKRKYFNDGTVEPSEILAAITAAQNNPNVMQYYGDESNKSRYIQELKNMLKELFGEVQFSMD